jgi:prepilin-type N-terminal cleavage/methylation domain-containing protein
LVQSKGRRGMSLVELLIVIAIIGVLIQLMLPAVQSAREAGRRAACQNHLKQIVLAAQNHEQAHKHLPTAGWGWAWMADPDRGAGKDQSGSWGYQLLPYLEASHVHDIGRGLFGEAKYDELTRLASTPVAVFYCPSRRLAEATPTVDTPFALTEIPPGLYWYNAKRADNLARSDYKANAGDTFVFWGEGPPPSKAEKGEGFLVFNDIDGPTTPGAFNGVVVQRTPIQFAHIFDGLSKTYFAGEKYLPSEHYETGANPADDQSCWNGDDMDMLASTEHPPSRDDVLKGPMGVSFGSTHVDGLNMALCDGSVQFISYQVDPHVHSQFGNRRDVKKPKGVEK